MSDFPENSRKGESVDSALNTLLGGSPDSFYRRFHRRNTLVKLLLLFFLVAFCGFFILYVVWWRAPSTFPTGTIVSVEQGATLDKVANLLSKQGAIRSPFWFKAWTTLLGGKAGLKAGDYYLSERSSVIPLAHRFANGREGLRTIQVTIPEGLSNKEIAEIFSKALIRFDRTRFLELAKNKEGYLFPDTYRFAPNVDEAIIITEMEKNFKEKIAPLAVNISTFAKTLHEVLTMASLVEGEARTLETRRQIAGILWKRLGKGMPLQVDAVFPYILGKNTYQVTLDDLTYDSPYNTYLHVGLPPGPINNPSLDAINATITPILTNYLYYLSDSDGVMRYATTHAEHLKNRAKYLGK